VEKSCVVCVVVFYSKIILNSPGVRGNYNHSVMEKKKRFSLFSSFGAEKKKSVDDHDGASNADTAQSSRGADIAENISMIESEISDTSDINGGTSSSNFHLPINKRDSSLKAIGEDIKKMHKKIDARNKENLKQNIKTNEPKQKARILELKKLIEKIKLQIESERESGVAALEKLTEKVIEFENEINRIKSQMYFPSSKIAYGMDGIFVGYDDFWIEKIYGKVTLKMLPGIGCWETDRNGFVPPRLHVTLTGNASDMSDDATGVGHSQSMSGEESGGGFKSKFSRRRSMTPTKDTSTHSSASGGSGGGGGSRRKSMSPNKESDANTDEKEGMGVRIRLDQFNLKSDSSSLSVALDALDLYMVIRVQISLEFIPKKVVSKDISATTKTDNSKLRRRSLSNAGAGINHSESFDLSHSRRSDPYDGYEWVIPKRDGLVITVQSFRGPMGLGRNVMSTLVSLVTPMVRTMVRNV
jgi:hypothetical protein